MTSIYKIMPGSDWERATQQGTYAGSADDVRDGYIHFSTLAQLPGTLAKYYAGRTGLLLITFDSDALGPSLKWEPARGGQLFPHLYAPLSPSLARSVYELQLGPTGTHSLPEGLT